MTAIHEHRILDLNSQEIVNGPVPTAIDHLMRTRFSSPDLWQKRHRVWPPGWVFGLKHPEVTMGGGAMDIRAHVVVAPQRLWLASVYGFRIVHDDDKRDKYPNAVKFEETDLSTVTRIHQALADTVLAGENIHIAKQFTPPVQRMGFSSIENNNYWLRLLQEGYWPIMIEGHDAGDPHLGNFALFPRSGQDLVTKVARLEEIFREERKRAGLQVAHAKLFLPGEKRTDNDPFSSGVLDSLLHNTGLNKIDFMSDESSYTDLLVYLVDGRGTSCQDRLTQLQEAMEDPESQAIDATEDHARTCLKTMPKLIGDMVNYISRHEEKKNTTQDEVKAETEKFFEGAVRVGEKIRGTTSEQGLIAA